MCWQMDLLALPPDARGSSALPASLGANMASIVLQSGQSHLASALTGQIENAEYAAQFVSDVEEKRYLSLLSSAEEVQREFEKRASAVDVMLQQVVECGRMEAVEELRGNREFVSAQQKLFAFLWGMFYVNPSLALVWFSENSMIDEHKYAQTAVRDVNFGVLIFMPWVVYSVWMFVVAYLEFTLLFAAAAGA